MGPVQVTDVTRLVLASFGIGIGAIAVPMILNLFADIANRRKQRQKYALPPLSSYQQAGPPDAPRPAVRAEGPLRLPVIRRPQ